MNKKAIQMRQRIWNHLLACGWHLCVGPPGFNALYKQSAGDERLRLVFKDDGKIKLQNRRVLTPKEKEEAETNKAAVWVDMEEEDCLKIKIVPNGLDMNGGSEKPQNEEKKTKKADKKTDKEE